MVTDAAVLDVQAEGLKLNPQSHNQPFQIIHALHREDGAGELGDGAMDLFVETLVIAKPRIQRQTREDGARGAVRVDRGHSVGRTPGKCRTSWDGSYARQT